MHATRTSSSSTDVTGELSAWMAGLGIITLALFPFAVPLLVLVIAPVALITVAGVLLAVPVILPVWLARVLKRTHSRRRGTASPGSELAPATANARPRIHAKEHALSRG